MAIVAAIASAPPRVTRSAAEMPAQRSESGEAAERANGDHGDAQRRGRNQQSHDRNYRKPCKTQRGYPRRLQQPRERTAFSADGNPTCAKSAF